MLTIHAGLHKTGSSAIAQYFTKATADRKHRLGFVRGRSPAFEIPRSAAQWRDLTLGLLETHGDAVVAIDGILGSPWGESEMYLGAKERAEVLREAFTGRTDFQGVIYLRPQS